MAEYSIPSPHGSEMCKVDGHVNTAGGCKGAGGSANMEEGRGCGWPY